MVQLVNKRQLLYKSIETLKKELEKKDIEIKEIQQHCGHLESNVATRVRLDNNLKELLEQYHQIQEDLERQLDERDAE